jgi:hypothetical protein
MKFKNLVSIAHLFLLFAINTSKAQTVTQAWATLVNGTSPTGIAFDASSNLCMLVNVNNI